MDVTGPPPLQDVSCTLPRNISDAQWEYYEQFAWWCEGFGLVLVGSTGIILNTIAIAILLGTELAAQFFNWLLVCLSLFDITFLLSCVLESFRIYLGSTTTHTYLFVKFLFPFRSVVLCCSTYMTVLFALERYNAFAASRTATRQVKSVHRNMGEQQRSLCDNFKVHRRRLLKYVGPVEALSALFYIPKFMELRLVETEKCFQNATTVHCVSAYEIELSDLRNDNHYVLWYLNVTNLLVTAVVPLVSLAYLNFNVYLKFQQYVLRQPSTTARNPANQIQERLRQRENNMLQQTMVLFVIVIMFGLSHVLRIVLNIEEFISLDESNAAEKKNCEWLKYWTIIVAPISHLLLATNSSINFFIYCWFNFSFRQVLLAKTLCCLVALGLKHDPTAAPPAISPPQESNAIATIPICKTESTLLLSKNSVGSQEEKPQENKNAASAEEIKLKKNGVGSQEEKPQENKNAASAEEIELKDMHTSVV